MHSNKLIIFMKYLFLDICLCCTKTKYIVFLIKIVYFFLLKILNLKLIKKTPLGVKTNNTPSTGNKSYFVNLTIKTFNFTRSQIKSLVR